MSGEVVRWTGGPGAGKTQYLLDDVRREVDVDGRVLDDLCLMSFSRAQAADLAARLADGVFPEEDTKDILRRCATIDAIALRACRAEGLIDRSPDQIIVPGVKRAIPVYQEFMQHHGIPYSPVARLADDGNPVARSSLPAGNQILEIGTYLTATMRSPDAWREAASALGLSFNGSAWGITDLLSAWQEFKAAKGVFEHPDYVRLAVDSNVEPPAPVIFVDEYQDVSPLQDALIRQWIERVDRVYVAGDPDQAIYGFRGCSPDLFLSLPTADRDNGSRPVSHRCPVRVMETAENVLGHPANVAPNPRPGISLRCTFPDREALVRQIEEALRTYTDTVTPVYVLCRFQRHVSKIMRDLSSAGLPCTGIRDVDGGPWGRVYIGRHDKRLERDRVNVWSLVCALRRLQGNPLPIEPLPLDEAEALVAGAVVSSRRRSQALSALKTKATKYPPIRVGDITEWVEMPIRVDALNLRPAIVEQIRNCLVREQRRRFVVHPQAVRVDTVHSAKGLEAPCVLLHTGYLHGLCDALVAPDRMAEERRVFFVGVTRASRALILFDYISPVWPGFGRPV